MSNKEQHYAIKLTLTIFIWTSRPPHFRFHSILFLFNSILSCSIEWTSKPAEPSMLFVSSLRCAIPKFNTKLSKYISNLLFCFISFHSQLLHFNVKKTDSESLKLFRLFVGVLSNILFDNNSIFKLPTRIIIIIICSYAWKMEFWRKKTSQNRLCSRAVAVECSENYAIQFTSYILLCMGI